MTRRDWLLLAIPVSLVIVLPVISIFFLMREQPPVRYFGVPSDVSVEPGTEPPAQYLNAPFSTDSPVRAGDPLNTRAYRCNETGRKLTTSVPRRLINVDTGEIIVLPPTGGIIDAQPRCEAFIGGKDVTSNLVPGRYYVDQVVRVQGTLRLFEITLRTDVFEVVP